VRHRSIEWPRERIGRANSNFRINLAASGRRDGVMSEHAKVSSPIFEIAIRILLATLLGVWASAAWIVFARAMVAHEAILWLGAVVCAYLAAEVVLDGIQRRASGGA